ncbi:MAG TPA: hypothetical protein VFX86_03100 [Candidatus Saccharimonadales bacterium]|nr:hypothetical protein [Candidatus Saccharimonadales bacterium]
MTAIILLVISIAIAGLKHTYRRMATSPAGGSRSLPAHLHTCLKHIISVSIMLDLLAFSSLALFAAIAGRNYPNGQAALVILAGFTGVLIVSPRIADAKASGYAAETLSRPLAYLLKRTEKTVTRFENLVERMNKKFHKPEPYSRQALLSFLSEQKDLAEPGLRGDLTLALAGLSLNKRKVSQLMLLKKKAKLVSTGDQVGPVLLSELHDSRRRAFPAVDESGEIIGIVRLDSLTELKAGGKVGAVLRPQVGMIDKNETAAAALAKFAGSGDELMLAASDGKAVGIIYLEDILTEFSGTDS